jgi:hypothetical protein
MNFLPICTILHVSSPLLRESVFLEVCWIHIHVHVGVCMNRFLPFRAWKLVDSGGADQPIVEIDGQFRL